MVLASKCALAPRPSLCWRPARPPELNAQGKIKIAIWEFEKPSGCRRATGQCVRQRTWARPARNQIDTEFSENQQLSSKFSVIERDKLNLVLGRAGASPTDRRGSDPATRRKSRQASSAVKYIVIGGIDKFSVNNTKGGGIREPRRPRRQCCPGRTAATISMRFIDTTTAERVLSISADGDVSKGGGVHRRQQPEQGFAAGHRGRDAAEGREGGRGEARDGRQPRAHLRRRDAGRRPRRQDHQG